MGKMIRKILVANRGEIAIRVMRTANKMGIRTVAVYSEEDRHSLHVKLADEAFCIGKVDLSDTYLNISKIIDVAVKSGVQAVHPGYGFLSENPAFVTACKDAGIIFIGPGSEVMFTMGNKIQAREFVTRAGVPVVQGFSGKTDDLLEAAVKIGLPVLVKAAAGGGGKGMKVVYRPEDLPGALESASRQAKAYFGDETVYIEKFIENPRHIEIQILGDQHGNVIHLYERECSIQRRYQKIIEESPSPTLTPEVREQMGAAAVRIGKETGYTGAGTIEFLTDSNLNFYFLEMNTRIQVEHPITEMVTGIDIVEEQIHIAEGKELRYNQSDIVQHGHAIECRIYAEDPENNFLPSPGTMSFYHAPSGEGIRVDAATETATTISAAYDPMIAKLVVHGPDRGDAIGRMITALDDFVVHGIKTNTEFLSAIMRDEDYIRNRISTGYCDANVERLVSMIHSGKMKIPSIIPVAAHVITEMMPDKLAEDVWRITGFWRNRIEFHFSMNDQKWKIPVKRNYSCIEIQFGDQLHALCMASLENHYLKFLIDGQSHACWVSEEKSGKTFVTLEGFHFEIQKENHLPETKITGSLGNDKHSGEIISPMPGKVIRINISEGQEVEKGQTLMIIEAMKMENIIISPGNGVVTKVYVNVNDRVESASRLVEVGIVNT